MKHIFHVILRHEEILDAKLLTITGDQENQVSTLCTIRPENPIEERVAADMLLIRDLLLLFRFNIRVVLPKTIELFVEPFLVAIAP